VPDSVLWWCRFWFCWLHQFSSVSICNVLCILAVLVHWSTTMSFELGSIIFRSLTLEILLLRCADSDKTWLSWAPLGYSDYACCIFKLIKLYFYPNYPVLLLVLIFCYTGNSFFLLSVSGTPLKSMAVKHTVQLLAVPFLFRILLNACFVLEMSWLNQFTFDVSL
jgi:hypothetical protein